ncbi:hypothetical protein BJ878DRAFT_507941 [Calycina marina]|uniref:Uncharacterized protein n=1 Tax=Calycina marina TaxID=1763456 RepID=A0A9P7Z2C0_9HELO|nr:hypothetical protein BJ878DRAFT_507941 [Calycina marina]
MSRSPRADWLLVTLHLRFRGCTGIKGGHLVGFGTLPNATVREGARSRFKKYDSPHALIHATLQQVRQNPRSGLRPQ